jgi:hypothetical protein
MLNHYSFPKKKKKFIRRDEFNNLIYIIVTHRERERERERETYYVPTTFLVFASF